jgi:DNA-binding MarR family transcriptional regulator
MKHYVPEHYRVDDSVGYLLRRGSALLRADLEAAFAGVELSFTQWVTLMLVRDRPGLTPAALCADLHHDSGALTRLLDRLEALGYLLRERDERDRRLVHVRLTPEGERVLAAQLPRVTDRLNAVFAGFTSAEMALFTGFLGRLIGRLETTHEVAA